MKYMILTAALLLLSGCATVHGFFRGFSEGYNAGAQNRYAQPVRSINCTTSGMKGLYTTNCL